MDLDDLDDLDGLDIPDADQSTPAAGADGGFVQEAPPATADENNTTQNPLAGGGWSSPAEQAGGAWGAASPAAQPTQSFQTREEVVAAAVTVAAEMQSSAGETGETGEAGIEEPMKLGGDEPANPFAVATDSAGAEEKGILFATSICLLRNLDDRRALQLVYTAARAATLLLMGLFVWVGVSTMSEDEPSRGWDITRSILSILFLLLIMMSIAFAQLLAYRRHRGHSTKFAMQMNLVTVQRTPGERYGRMVFWPVIMASWLILFWLMFLYFELLPSREKEDEVFLNQNWAALAPTGGAAFRVGMMTFLMTAAVLLLVLISRMSLLTYEAHMQDPVERLAILLLEEQRRKRKGLTSIGGEMDSAQQQKAARRPELAQTRAARLVNRGRPPPRTLLDRQMRRVEDWLAGSIRKRTFLGVVTKLVEVFILFRLYQMHRRLEAARLDDDQLCALSPYVGQPNVILCTILLTTANFGYRVCCEHQHHHEVPRVILNQGRGVPGVKSCTEYIKRHSAAGLREIVQAEALWAKSISTQPYAMFGVWTFSIFYSWLPFTICYSRLHRFDESWLSETLGSVGLIPALIVLGLISSVYNFLVYHRCDIGILTRAHSAGGDTRALSWWQRYTG
jgi:hypothetical protein